MANTSVHANQYLSNIDTSKAFLQNTELSLRM